VARALRLDDRVLKRALSLVVAIFINASAAHGQSAPSSTPRPAPFCSAYADFDLVFVGRAQTPVTYRISGEREIERARQNLLAIEADVARVRASLDLQTRWERNIELEVRIIEAQAEVELRRAMYPAPYDLTLTPLAVERTFRGVLEHTVMLREIGPSRVDRGELYLVGGDRSKSMMPPLPEMSNEIAFDDYIERALVSPVGAADAELRFLASQPSSATVLGTLKWDFGNYVLDQPPPAPLPSVQMRVLSETQVIETITDQDGRFFVTGVQPGRVEIMPTLPDNLVVVNQPALSLQTVARKCSSVDLRVKLRNR
jgi:hypothetical protein